MTSQPAAPPPAGPRRRRGRPSVADARRRDIIDAYLVELGEQGMVTVPGDAVARRAGVARTAVAHFVGDREDVHRAAVGELRARYEASLREVVGSAPSARVVVEALFSDDWVRVRSVEDRALDHYLLSAMREPVVAEAVRAMYDLLTSELAAAIRRDDTATPLDCASASAYAIVCLAEFNVTLQQLGFDPRQSRDARSAALHLLGPSHSGHHGRAAGPVPGVDTDAG